MHLDVLFCCDRAYLKGLIAAIESLLVNSTIPCRLHLVLEGIEYDRVDTMIEHWKQYEAFGGALKYSHELIPKEYKGLSHFSRLSYGKASLEAILGENVSDRVLVADPDMIFQRDVEPLTRMEFGETLMGINQKMGAGFMYVNYRRWREQKIDAWLFDSWQMNPNVKNAEQDLLQRYLIENPRESFMLEREWNLSAKDWTTDMQAVLHYLGSRKPWHGDYNGPVAPQELFYHYLDRTPLKGSREWSAFSLIHRHLNKLRIRLSRAA